MNRSSVPVERTLSEMQRRRFSPVKLETCPSQ
jgi:hypothetical protein